MDRWSCRLNIVRTFCSSIILTLMGLSLWLTFGAWFGFFRARRFFAGGGEFVLMDSKLPPPPCGPPPVFSVSDVI